MRWCSATIPLIDNIAFSIQSRVDQDENMTGTNASQYEGLLKVKWRSCSFLKISLGTTDNWASYSLFKQHDREKCY